MNNNVDMHKRLISALVYAYVWVSASDGKITDKECDGFHEALHQAGYGGMLAPIAEDELQNIFSDVKDHFIRDSEDAIDKAKNIFEPFKGTNGSARIVQVSRKAVVADGVIAEGEEEALEEIASFFGIQNP